MDRPARTTAGGWSALLRRHGPAFLLGLYTLLFAAKVAMEVDTFQVNFKTSYYAAVALGEERDPYDSSVLRELAGNHFVLPYVYPPATLWLFRPLVRLDYRTAHRIFLAAKLVALGVLLWLWQHCMIRPIFGGLGVDNLFLLVCLLGFNYAICWDLQSGNANLFNEMMLWLGFGLLMRGSLGSFALCIAMAAWLKLTPICFLGLLIFERDRFRWAAMAIGIAVFVGLQGVSIIAYPDLMHEWLENVLEIRGLTPEGVGEELQQLAASPSSRLMVATLLTALQERTGLPVPTAVATAIYVGMALVVAATTIGALWRNRLKPVQARRPDAIVAACLAYILIMP